MLIGFLYALRAAKVPVSARELLALLDAFEAGVVGPKAPNASSMDDFYHLTRTIMVKDERHFDGFDRAFAAHFKDAQVPLNAAGEVPADWLHKTLERLLSDEDRAALKAMDWDELMQTLNERLKTQRERHAGGSKWIGTGGTSPFGHGGENPRGIRIGGQSTKGQGVKVWEKRLYRDYDDSQVLGTRQMAMALRRLRSFAREGAQDELDLAHTIQKTAANAGYLDIAMRAERHNRVKVLLLMDVGGSMDSHIAHVETLFSAVKSEFKHLSFYYFHNCVYDFVWQHNHRRGAQRIPTWDVIRKYNKSYKLIFVGDATMSPYEIVQPGGSVEYHNAEAGAVWMRRLTHAFPKSVWLNPEPQGVWGYRQSIDLMAQLMDQRMHPLTLQGLDSAMRWLSK